MRGLVLVLAAGLASCASAGQRIAPRAVSGVQKQCDAGDADACGRLGNDYAARNDATHAVALLRRACRETKKPIASYCADLGTFYEYTLNSPGQAAPYYARACQEGIAVSCRQMARLQRFGTGMPKDLEGSVRNLARACELQFWPACEEWGTALEQGIGTSRDYHKAFAVYRKGCDAGDPTECVHLGILYEVGRGVTKDHQKAESLYRDACREDDAFGCAQAAFLASPDAGISQRSGPAWKLLRQAYGNASKKWSEVAMYYELTAEFPGCLQRYRKLLGLACEAGEQTACDKIGGKAGP